MPVQRFRLIIALGPDAPDLDQRDRQAAWAAALIAAGLSVPGDVEQAKFTPAAPIPAGLTSDAELADLFLPSRRTAADVRTRLEGALPAGHRLVGLYDVWTGEPALQALVVAADYRVTVTDGGRTADTGSLADGVARLLAATTVERSRAKSGAASTAANLRPLIDGLRVTADGMLWMRLRFDPALGTGRPEEVVAALAARTGLPLAIGARHRERFWLRGEV